MKPEIVEAKVKAMLLEVVRNQIKIDPSTIEYQWIGSLQQTKPQNNFGKPFIKPKWQIRLSEKEFQNGGKVKIKFHFFRWSIQRKSGDCQSRVFVVLSWRNARN